ncbi:murein biosynthesis integral membrane protein MurJ [Thermanaerothrix sp.]|uniref:murein biosynthesis integral membrane protein MurJ n=1 Tax=Thermanaerothrix sp. TaxID=2972675 RepID=UPI002ADD5774|nr:murein biosynthesis integral membrane protein MurJ [Thermanaerothrix sp.]
MLSSALMHAQDAPQINQANRHIARAATTIMVAFLLSNLMGLVRGILIYRTFGTSAALDSFNAANRIAEMLFNLMAGGALGSAFIPTFTALLTQDDRDQAWQLASAIFNWLILILGLVSLLVALFAPQVVRHGLFLLAPGQDPGQEALTTHLLRILLLTVPVFGISGLVMGILNAHRRFWVPAIAPAMYSLGMILGVLVFPSTWGIDRLAWGAVLGACLHLGVQLPTLGRLHGRFIPTLGHRLPAVREVLRLMGPRIFGVAVVQLNFVVNTIIALSLPEGSVSAIALAFSLMLVPQMAIAQSAGIASLPILSAQVARGEYDDMRASLISTLRGVLLLALPASLGLILLRQPLVALLYQGGAFDERSTAMVTWALLWYAVGLVGHSVVEVLSRAFYALHDTRTPVGIGVIAMSLNIGLSLLLASWFRHLGWMPHGGLALANSLATSLEMLGLFYFMHRRLRGLPLRPLWDALGRSGLATLVMAAGVMLWIHLGGQHVHNAVLLLIALGIGLGVYGLGLWLLRTPESRFLANWLYRRVFPKRELPAP